jgi:hypothetical protein
MEDVPNCPECGAILAAKEEAPGTLRERRRKSREAAGAGPAWANTYAGAFGYAYAAVFAGEGWQAWSRYMLVGMVASVLAPLLCCLYPVGLLIAYGSIFGAMYQYMGYAATEGARPMQRVSPSIISDMLIPAVQIVGASLLLVLLPLVGSVLATLALQNVDLAALEDKLKPGGGVQVASIANLVVNSAIIIGALVFSIFCFPMIVMLLGASRGVSGLGDIFRSMAVGLNPVAVFRGIFKAPLEYAGVVVFFAVNTVLAPVAVILAMSAATTTLGDFVASLLQLAIFFGTLVYMAGVVGWRMGMFLHKRPEVFSHVK